MLTTHEIFSLLTEPATDHPSPTNEIFALLRERCIKAGLIDAPAAPEEIDTMGVPAQRHDDAPPAPAPGPSGETHTGPDAPAPEAQA